MGLSPSNNAPRPPKLKREALHISGVLVNFMSIPPAQTQSHPAELQSPHIENFLAMVLIAALLLTFMSHHRRTGRHFTGARKKFALKITIFPKNKHFALKLTFYYLNGA